jgi:SulP family sulfate permease
MYAAGSRAGETVDAALDGRRNLVADLIAGLTTGIASIPDALASAILAGANPVYGLYALMVGTPVGALVTSSQFMTVSITSAMALAAGSALNGLTGEEHARNLFTLTLLVGVFGIVAGLLRLGRLMRYVSNAVMIGFLTGVSVLIVLSQLGDLSGYASPQSNKVLKAVDLVFHLRQVHLPTLAIGILTIAVIVLLSRTRLGNFAMLVAILVASAAVLLLGWDSVQTVGGVADIPRSLPMPKLPALSLVPRLIAPALSITIIGLVQSAGVSKGYPNADGRYPDISQDFLGQGVANAAAGLFQGMPLGGSVSTTALNVSAGARSRWANVFSGLVVALAVLLLSWAVSLAAIPAMAGLLIVAGIQSIKRESFLDVWDISWGPRSIMVVTLIATLALPVQYAVFTGVVLSGLLYFFSAAADVRLVEFVPNPDRTLREQPVPAELPGHGVTLLNIYGSVFFAGASRVEEMLPSVQNADRPVVILRLREHSQISSTFLNVLERYELQLRARGGKLILAGVGERVKEQLDRTETISEFLGEEDVFPVTDTLGASTMDALDAAHRWLEQEAPSPGGLPEFRGEA